MNRTIGALAMMTSALALTGCVQMRGKQTCDRVVLESEAMRLVLDSTPVPHVAEMLHKPSGTALLSDPEAQNLFLLSLRNPEGEQISVNSRMATTTSIWKEGSSSAPEAVLTFADFPENRLRVEVRVQLDEAPELTVWSIQIENPDKLPIESVRFPSLHVVPQIGAESMDDAIVLPCYPGALLENPLESLKTNAGKELRYPGDMSAQFVTLQDPSAGFFLGSRDPSGHPRLLAAWKREADFEFYHTYNLNGSDTPQWTCPYPTVVGVTAGSWHASADLYKRWAKTQTWCATPLTGRDDIPDWWKEGPLVHVCAVRKFNKDGTLAGSFYPEYEEHLQCLREKVGGPIVAMLASWENHRRWTGGEYFPIFDQDQAVQVIRKISDDGFRPFFYLSGMFYTFENVGVDGDTIPSAEDYLDYYVIDRKTGKPEVFTLNGGNSAYEWSRKSYELCVGSSVVKPFFRKVIDRAHEVGVDVLQMDQTTSGAGHACYSTEHGHEPGTSQYRTFAFHDLLDDMRDYGRSKNADFALFHEEPHEELIPHLDGFHMREYKEKWWYRSLPGVRGIPLFTYLYHEYAIGYGGDSAGIGSRGEVWNTRCHAVNLVTGKTPGIAVWSNPKALTDSHPAPLAMVRNHCRLLKMGAAKFLILGTMLHPYELEVPMNAYRVWTTTGGKGHAEDFSEPSVLTSSWLAPDGSVGHLFVNLSTEAQAVSIDLDGRNAPLPEKCTVRVYSSATDEGFTDLWSDTQLPRSFTADLPSRELLFIEISR